jgi:dTDP-4-amino-4,6-dideoxygalactose transaminase
MIPVQRPYLGREELDALAGVFDTRWLGMGSVTADFEDKLRRYLGADHVIAVNSGTSALHIALDGLGLQPGDEVLVPSLTFVASVQAIVATGARPVFCDVSADSLTMNIEDAFGRVTKRTKAVMPVHYAGVPCEMDDILPLARERNIRIVEDAAHAFGSAYKGRKVGTLGDVTCFSFDPVKNITCGEGGAVVTDNDDLAARIIPKRILGIDKDTWSRMRQERNWFYNVITPGYRYHMSNLNAAIGLEQLKRLDSFKVRKQAIVGRYDEAFKNISGLALLKHDLKQIFPFLYVLRVLEKQRDALMKYLREKDIRTGVHYVPNHLQPLFADFRATLPVTEQIYEEILTLPLYFEMTDGDVGTVIDAVYSFFGLH